GRDGDHSRSSRAKSRGAGTDSSHTPLDFGQQAEVYPERRRRRRRRARDERCGGCGMTILVEADMSEDWDSSTDWPALAGRSVHAAIAHSRHAALADGEAEVSVK